MASLDLNLVRTFLEVCQTRHFGRAADHLHLTASAVSARIKTLEDQLGATLFLRLRNGIELTPTAERLVTHFRSLLSTWDQVRFQVSVESAPQPNLTVAASSGVWASIESDWIKQLTGVRADLRLRLETHEASDIGRHLQHGSVDIGITFEPLVGPELTSTPVGELSLNLVSDRTGRSVAEVLATDYIHVAWSTSFNTRFAGAFPAPLAARVTVQSAGIAANLLADFPGAAYLPVQIVERLRHCVPLSPVEGAPEIRLSLWASCLSASDKRELVEQAVELLVGAQVA